MTDRFDVIGYDEHGHPKVRYCLDPREVTVIRDPERGDTVFGYVWEPVGPVPSPLRAEPMPPLTDEQYEELKGRFLAALHEPPVRLDDAVAALRTAPASAGASSERGYFTLGMTSRWGMSSRRGTIRMEET